MRNLISCLAFGIFMALPLFSLAQPGGEDDVVDVPLDGGLSFLVVAGVGYGAKKLYALKEQKQAPEVHN